VISVPPGGRVAVPTPGENRAPPFGFASETNNVCQIKFKLIHMKSTNMLERLNQELKRRTHVVRIFPNAESCLRLVRALAVEMHENWLEAMRYLNMDHLKEHKKEALRALAA